jgi:cell fate (sporulation/competence/biofilm development) regulator YlbF (YheA/YmcA/DUF963 family)
MTDTDELLEQARSLGRSLAKHPSIRAYWQAQAAVHDDAQARKLLENYTATVDQARRLAAKSKTPGDELKRQLQDAEQQIAANDVLKRWMRTQADYVELMQQVNAAMEAPLHEARPQPKQ